MWRDGMTHGFTACGCRIRTTGQLLQVGQCASQHIGEHTGRGLLGSLTMRRRDRCWQVVGWMSSLRVVSPNQASGSMLVCGAGVKADRRELQQQHAGARFRFSSKLISFQIVLKRDLKGQAGDWIAPTPFSVPGTVLLHFSIRYDVCC